MCWQGWFLLRAVRKDLLHAALLTCGGLLAIFGIPCRQHSPCLHIVFSLYVSLSLYIVCSFYKDTRPIGLGAHPIAMWIHLNQLYLQWPNFQIRSHSEGVRTSIYEFWGGQNSTHNNIKSSNTKRSFKFSKMLSAKNYKNRKKGKTQFESSRQLYPLFYFMLPKGNWDARWDSAVHSVRCNFILLLGNSASSHSECDLVFKNMYLIICDICPIVWLYNLTSNEMLSPILLGCSISLYSNDRIMLLHFTEFFPFYLDSPLHPSPTSAITKQISKDGKFSAFNWNRKGGSEGGRKEGNKRWKTLRKCKAL